MPGGKRGPAWVNVGMGWDGTAKTCQFNAAPYMAAQRNPAIGLAVNWNSPWRPAAEEDLRQGPAAYD